MDPTTVRRNVAALVSTLSLVLVPFTDAQPSVGQGRPVEHEDPFLRMVELAIRNMPSGPPSVRDLSRRFTVAWGQTGSRASQMPSHERLVIVGSDRRIRHVLDGSLDHVGLERSFHAQLNVADAGLLLIHNHPRSASLSGGDLALLGWPGVAAVLAVGHDGSVYVAARGERYQAADFENVLYLVARQQLTRELRINPLPLDGDVLAKHFPHLIALVLKNAKVIQYEARLSYDRRGDLEECRDVLERIAAGASLGLVLFPGSSVNNRQVS